MKTVKEFKDAGLVFVEGDLIDGVTGQDSSQAVELMGVSKDICGVGPSGFWTLREFAWRTNTGEQPSFDGVVEVELRSGRVLRDRVSGFGWWLDGDNSDIIKWRPVIGGESKMEGKTNNPRVSERKDIPERKPTYTKEMHEAGELPPAGSVVDIKYKHGNKFNGVTINYISKDVIVYVSDGECERCGAISCIEYIKPIDTRTEEEKLIDAMIEDVDAANPNHKLGVR